MKETYFSFEQEEAGFKRISKNLELLTDMMIELQRKGKNRELSRKVLKGLQIIERDINHPRSHRIRVKINENPLDYRFVIPGMTAEGLFNHLVSEEKIEGKDNKNWWIQINGQWFSLDAVRKIKLTDQAKIIFKRLERAPFNLPLKSA